MPLRVHREIVNSEFTIDGYAKLEERSDDALQVLTIPLNHHVDVLGDVVDCAVQHSRHYADRDVCDTVSVEHLDNSNEIERRTNVVAHPAGRRDTSIQGSSAVLGGSIG